MSVMLHSASLLVVLSITWIGGEAKCCLNIDPNTLDCSNCRAEKLPPFSSDYANITSLYLNDNLISRIDDYAFTNLTKLEYLNLRNNRLTSFGNFSFAGLENLKTLDLRPNWRTYITYILSTYTFKPLINLRTLKLGVFNIEQTPSEAFTYLSATVDFLQHSVLPNYVFGSEYAHLINLKSLILNPSSIINITRETFAVFSRSLKTLDLRATWTTNITLDAFKDMEKLETLNLACNTYFIFGDIFDVLKQMPAPTLKTLILDSIIKEGQFSELREDYFNSTVLKNLERISVRANRMQRIDFDFFYNVPKLQYFNVGYNNIFSYQVSNTTQLISFLDKGNLTAVDISYFGGAGGTHNTFSKKFCRPSDVYSDDFFATPPSHIVPPHPIPCCNHTFQADDDLLKMIARNIPQHFLYAYVTNFHYGSSATGTTFNSDNNILYIDVSGTQVTALTEVTKGLNKLQGLSAGGCGLQYVNPELLDYVPSLKYLNVSGNSLFDIDWTRLLSTGHSIQNLDLSYNTLQKFPEKALTRLYSLQILTMNNNPLGRFFVDLASNLDLTVLDLRNTSLKMSEDFMQQLDDLQAKAHHPVKLMLEGNVFVCDCNNLSFLKWLRQTRIDVSNKHSLKCDYNKRQIPISALDYKMFISDCGNSVNLLTVTLTPISTAVVIVIVIVVVYNFKLYRRIRFFNTLFHSNAPPDNCDFDVFLCYNDDEDHEWVENDLDDGIKRRLGLKTFVSRFDIFDNDDPTDVAIVNGVERCHYVIFVLTPTLFHWKHFDVVYEAAIATKNVENIIVIYKEEVKSDVIPVRLKLVIRKNGFIDYVENSDGIFWSQMRTILTDNEDNRI